MSTEEDKSEQRGFKVEDRRRFSDSGEARPDAPPQTAATTSAAAAGPAVDTPPQPATEAPLLELNFSTFVLSLSTQALAHLGEIPNPIENRTAVDLVAAKQLIDILGILRDKTKGNLDTSESNLLDSVLYDLRIKYVERARHPS